MKYTDEQIKKALECCVKSTHFGECFENKCPMVNEDGCAVGKETLYPYVLDLINRQEAEKQKLEYILSGVMLFVDKWLEGDELSQDEVNRARIMRERTLEIVEKQEAEIERYKGVIRILENDVKHAKSEAIKEFAERLKAKCTANHKTFDGFYLYEYSNVVIDNLVKEMVGEGE